MQAVGVLNERVSFGRDIPTEINTLLQEAVASAADFNRTRSLLYQAMEIAPFQLEVYIALYKFCFYRGHIDEAEEVVLNALKMASEKGGFATDWEFLTAASTDWSREQGPARVYLYSLKALAFIKLRRGRRESAEKLLQKLKQLDPQDSTGASVIMSLAEGL